MIYCGRDERGCAAGVYQKRGREATVRGGTTVVREAQNNLSYNMMFDYKLRTDIIYIYCNTNGLGLGHYQIKLTWICVRSIDERDWITDSMDRNRLIDGLILNHGEAKISDHLPLLIDCAHL